MIYLNLVALAFIIVFITDESGVVPHIKLFISRWLTKGALSSSSYRLHLLDCSLCQVHWVGLIYLIYRGEWSIMNYLLVCLLAFLTPCIDDILINIKDGLTYLINLIHK